MAFWLVRLHNWGHNKKWGIANTYRQKNYLFTFEFMPSFILTIKILFKPLSKRRRQRRMQRMRSKGASKQKEGFNSIQFDCYVYKIFGPIAWMQCYSSTVCALFCVQHVFNIDIVQSKSIQLPNISISIQHQPLQSKRKEKSKKYDLIIVSPIPRTFFPFLCASHHFWYLFITRPLSTSGQS